MMNMIWIMVIIKIKKILDLQENQFYSLKAIKNNPQLLTTNSSNSKIVHNKEELAQILYK